jgi:precorrin-8X/cobalt-precorrin-8 methylmutase
MNYSTEVAKDNQWWFSKSQLRTIVESTSIIELAINGRRCVLQRSAPGKDGRETLSYKFIRDEDRMYWRSLNGMDVRIEVVDTTVSLTQVEDDQEDEFLQDPSVNSNATHGTNTLSTKVSCECIPLAPNPRNSLIFDAYIFIDWSASNTPRRGKDSIWIAEGHWREGRLIFGSEEPACLNAPTRAHATEHVRKRLHQYLKDNKRVLVCFDFAYAYPQCEESKAFGAEFAQIWPTLSEKIYDNERNGSNRFQVANELNIRVNDHSGEGPFWGRPTTGDANQFSQLRTTKPANWTDRRSLKEFRIVEQRMKQKGYRPFSVWQLFGNGSVGSQVLVGLPRVNSLRQDPTLKDRSAVWPFETGWATSFQEKTNILHAEFWPGVIQIDDSLHSVRDACQVMSCVVWAATQDANGQLGSFFDPLEENDPDRNQAVKEGWILGFVDRRENQ